MSIRKPVYLMAGGDFRNPSGMIPRIAAILAETGKKHPDVAYIGAANGDDASFFGFSAGLFRKAGAGSVKHALVTGGRVDANKTRSVLESADALFISGGDVGMGMRHLQHRNLVPFIRGLYDAGKLFFGISAGSIMLGTHWVNWENPDDDSTAVLFDCMGVVPLVCDTHAEKDGWEELKAAIRLLEKNVAGYGIPTGGSLRFNPDGTIAALDKPAVRYVKTPGGIERVDDLPASDF